MEDAERIENLRDIFGRSRFANPLKDYGGVGVFTKECRTLIVTDLKRIESKKPVRDMVKMLYDNFSLWGEIEDLNYIPVKSCCYIRYEHRCYAEFAKEAMMRQSLVGEEIISVKWAYNDPNPVSEKIIQKEEENMFINSVINKYNNDNNQNEVSHFERLQQYLKDIEQNKEQ